MFMWLYRFYFQFCNLFLYTLIIDFLIIRKHYCIFHIIIFMAIFLPQTIIKLPNFWETRGFFEQLFYAQLSTIFYQ